MPKVKILITILFVVVLTFLGILFFRSAIEKNNNTNNGEFTSSLSNNIEIKPNYKYETREIIVDNNGDNIYGILYKPITENKVPTIIFSHGFGGTHSVGTPYSEKLASYGIAFYEFDFRGGATYNKSDGKPTEMSIFTEKSDLEAVLSTIKELDFVDNDNIFLMGTSQRGMVSAMVSAEHQEEIKADILLYPAFCIPENARNRYENVNNVPNNASFMGMTVGKTYYQDLFDYDVYEEIKNFDKNVLIIHGDRDSIVDISYSEKAIEVYPNSELKTINGAEHGFYGEDFEEASNYILDFLNQEISNKGSYKSVEGQKIKMTTNNTEVIIVLNESRATSDLVEMLPLELTLIERNNFAKAMTIPKQLSSYEKTTREYEIGDFGYWNAGPDLAIFYDDIYEQTIVEVIPLGHAESEATVLADETGKVKLEFVE